MPPFDEARYLRLLAARPGGAVGARVRYRERTGSTMDDARSAAASEGLASCGGAYVAGEQEAGRGRHGRRWDSPPGAGLLVTYHLCGSAPAVARATIAGALAVGDALREAAALEVRYTWPNDVVVESPAAAGTAARKIAGILAESVPAAGGRVDALLGIGVNLTSASALPTSLSGSAAGVVEAGGRPLAPEEMLAALSAALGARWRQAADEPAALTAAWRRQLLTLGRRVRLAVPRSGPEARVVEGLAFDVSPEGELLVRSGDGSIASFAAADVTTGAVPVAPGEGET
ncbi:MAG: biotin--[acetyl-CoA-carboxylase] ligase [Chloroflexi bacterium]|nr:biotin--[acetyl-CoA-carboxylase] ligase [Chloroflexota bacterium]